MNDYLKYRELYHSAFESEIKHNYKYSNILMHHGIKGMKWGVRRYQNEDGSLTEEGKERYFKYLKDSRDDYDIRLNRYKNFEKK